MSYPFESLISMAETGSESKYDSRDKGIGQWKLIKIITPHWGDAKDKTMADKLMRILNDDTQSYHFSRLQLVFETFRHLT